MALWGKSYEPCKSCETYKEQLRIVRQENKDLLDTILNITKPAVVQYPPKTIEAVLPKTLPWRVKKQQLERERRESTEDVKRRNPEIAASIDALEKELGVDANASEISQTI